MVIGFLWYSKFLFGNAWKKAHALAATDQTTAKKNMAKNFLGAFTAAIVTSFVLALVIKAFGAHALQGMVIGLWMWFGFILTKNFTDLLFENHNKTIFLISASYNCVSLLAIGALIGAFA
jgi:hypothetical protein